MVTGSFAPGALDVLDDRDDLLVAEDAVKGGHVRSVFARDVILGAELGKVEQDFVGVVPGMASLIVR